MLGIVTPGREIRERGQIQATEEDNARVLLDHGNGVISHVQSRFDGVRSAARDWQDTRPAAGK